MPNYAEFANRLNEAYNTITHQWQGYTTGNTLIGKITIVEVQGVLKRNQINVSHAYALQMRKAMHAGQTNLKAIWQEIAHCSDKDDIDLKSLKSGKCYNCRIVKTSKGARGDNTPLLFYMERLNIEHLAEKARQAAAYLDGDEAKDPNHSEHSNLHISCFRQSEGYCESMRGIP